MGFGIGNEKERIMYRKKAFTLVELLVVISIIALLLSILVPALSKARSTARRVICGTHMHGLGVMIELYKVANEGYFPGSWWGTSSFNRRVYYESLIMSGRIGGEETVKGNDEWVVTAGSDRKAYSCPSFRRFLRGCKNEVYGWGDADGIAEHYPIGYGYNNHLSRYNVWDDVQDGPATTSNWSFAGKYPSSSTLALIDSSAFFLYNSIGSKFYPVYMIEQRYLLSNGTIAGAHSGGFANSLWADMHVEIRRADEYSEREPGNPATLTGRCVLDQRRHQYMDAGYLHSIPRGKIACAE